MNSFSGMDDGKLVRININIDEARRERFFDHCRKLKPKRKSMNLALVELIDAVLDGRINLSNLGEGKPAKRGK